MEDNSFATALPVSSDYGGAESARLMQEMDETLEGHYQQLVTLSYGPREMSYGGQLVAKGVVEAAFLLLSPPTLPELAVLSDVGAILTGLGAVLGGVAAATAGAGVIAAITMGLIVLSTSGEAQKEVDLVIDTSSDPLSTLFAAVGSYLRNGTVEGVEQGARIGKLAGFIWDAGSAAHSVFNHNETVQRRLNEVLHIAYKGAELVVSRSHAPSQEADGTANVATKVAGRSSSHPRSFDVPQVNGVPFDSSELEKVIFAVPIDSLSAAYSIAPPSELPIHLGGADGMPGIPGPIESQEIELDNDDLRDKAQSDGSGVTLTLP